MYNLYVILMYLNSEVEVIYLKFLESVRLSNNAYIWDTVDINNYFVFKLYEPNRNTKLEGPEEITNYFN